MADSSESCEKSLQKNDDFHTTESDTELQNIFKKLRVNHRTMKFSPQKKRIKKMKFRAKNSGRLPEKHKQRKILKDATFIFKSALERTKQKQCDLSVSELNDSLPQSLEVQRNVSNPPTSPRQRVQGCGEQFRNGANVNVVDSLNMDDTTPEELAAYFDQLLHIPKPMSQMAEMMYT
ncbi:oxidative stress-responsive serine-rich protein 1-like [Dendronephthya gigantea]|uniref:oxidative stress-responsive serine-rich protein 1-like n=1 Tax=Dendronephthya gigantea TaxID=151771 RepID=UPI00106D306C|nr:oxidative stress-responsive serine-rich protein 1-like [Dendronephthya gigantea]